MIPFLRRVACCAALLFSAAPALANPSLVVEAASGKVLYQDDATMPWHPASVTKLMTTYVALKALKAGKIGLETPIPVSARAASQAPSKIGARPGTVVTLDNALKIMLVKSANDMAVVVAEGVGGSVENFAEMMNQEATNLGMRESQFFNPNGLHVVGQQTSARDLAILARAILRDFPDFRGYFGIGAIQLGSRVMKNTNGLIGRYDGADGMKTGFICPSGFNLVATATRGGRQLIVVVMGSPSAAERTFKAAALFDKGFASSGGGGLFSFGSASSGTRLEDLPPSGVTSAPDMREEICMRRGARPSDDEGTVDWNPAQTSNTSDSPVSFFLRDTGQLPAAAGSNSVAVRDGNGRRRLGPRMAFAPIPVRFGPTEGSASAPVAANFGAVPVLASKAKPGTAAYAADQSADAPNVGTGSADAVPLRGKAAKAKPPVKAAAKPPVKAAPKAQPAATAKAVPKAATTAAKPAAHAKPVAAQATAAKAKTAAKPVKLPPKPGDKAAVTPKPQAQAQ
jgi:D-alanyl-D-alanine carboxypeptidase